MALQDIQFQEVYEGLVAVLEGIDSDWSESEDPVAPGYNANDRADLSFILELDIRHNDEFNSASAANTEQWTITGEARILKLYGADVSKTKLSLYTRVQEVKDAINGGLTLPGGKTPTHIQVTRIPRHIKVDGDLYEMKVEFEIIFEQHRI